MDENEEEVVVASVGDSAKDDNDTNKDIGDLPVALQRKLSRLSIFQDELARRQQLQAYRAERNTTYLTNLMQFYHGPAASSTMPPQPRSPFQLPAWSPAALEQLMDTANYLISDDSEHHAF